MPKSGTYHVQMRPPYFPNHTQPNGFLVPDPACQALWYYYIIARNNVEQLKDTIIVEGDTKDDEWRYDFRQLFANIAVIYGVEPERMIKFWPNVDLECVTKGYPKLEGKYRQDAVPEIKTQ